MNHEYQDYYLHKVGSFFNRFFFKIGRLAEFLIFQLSLLHSDIAEGKNEFLHEIIVSFMNGKNITDMSGIMNSVQVGNQIG